MKISIARDGNVLGEYDEDEIPPLARSQFLQPTDLYWQEGLPDWQPLTVLLGAGLWQASDAPTPDAAPLPPSDPKPTLDAVPIEKPAPAPAMKPTVDPAPRPTRARSKIALIVLGLVGVLAIGGALFYFLRGRLPAHSGGSATTTPAAVVTPPANDPAAQLNFKLAGLQKPPVDIVYEEVTSDMQKIDSPFASHVAVISGRELILDHDTRKTAFVLEFTVTAGYQDGDWFFDHAIGNFYGTSDYQRLAISEDFKDPRFCRNLIATLKLKLGPH